MDQLDLEVAVREGRGKGAARRMRAGGAVPGVVYGSGVESLAVQIDARALERLVAHHVKSLISLKGPKQLKGRLVLIKELQRDPVTRRLTHCDFFAVDVERQIHVSVPVRLLGKAKGVELGGILEPLLREIEVSCLPLAIPESIEANVEELMIGDSIHVRDLVFPQGVEPLAEPEVAVVHVGAPRVEEEPVAAAEEVPAEGEAAPAEGEAAEAPKTEDEG